MIGDDGLVVFGSSVCPTIDNVFLGNSHETFVAGFGAIDGASQNSFVFVGGIGDWIAIRVAEATLTDETETSFGAHSIDAHEVDVVFEGASVWKVFREGIRSGRPVGRQRKEICAIECEATGGLGERAIVANMHSNSHTTGIDCSIGFATLGDKAIDAEVGQVNFTVGANDTLWADENTRIVDVA